MLYNLPVHGNFAHCLWMEEMVKLLVNCLKKDNKAGNLDSAAGTSGAGTDKHQHHQDGLGHLRPCVEIGSGVSGCGDDGTDLEGCLLEGLCDGRIKVFNINGDNNNRGGDNSQVAANLFHAEGFFGLSQQKKEIKAEVYAKQDHKHGYDILKIGRIPCHTVVFDSEASCSCCSEGEGQSVKQRHPSCQKKQDLKQRQRDIDRIQDFGSGLQLRNQLFHRGTRAFCLHQIHVIASCKRKQAQDKDENAHSADPVSKASPEQNAVGQAFHIAEYAGSRGGKAGDCFKQSINGIGCCAAEQERQRTHHAHHNPAQRNRDKSLFCVENHIFRLSDGERNSNHKAESHCDNKSKTGFLPVDHSCQAGQKHKKPFEVQNPSHNIGNHGIIHTITSCLPECPEYRGGLSRE